MTASAPVRSERGWSGRAAARTPQAPWPPGDTIERRVLEERDQASAASWARIATWTRLASSSLT
ncbi:MAG: hypothetical protein ABW122_15080, partial [Ilumatobacteraceae bacterium]